VSRLLVLRLIHCLPSLISPPIFLECAPIDQLNQEGLRHPSPRWNNICRTIYDASGGKLCRKYMGCGEQYQYVTEQFTKAEPSFDSRWQFSWEHSYFPPHQWGQAESNEDRALEYDPWKATIARVYEDDD